MVPLPVPLSLPTAIICSGLCHKGSNNEQIDLLLPRNCPTPYHSLPPHLRIFLHKPTLVLPHVCASSLRISVLAPHSSTPVHPPLRTFVHKTTHKLPHICALSLANPCKQSSIAAYLRFYFCACCALFCRGNGAVLQCDQIVTPMLSERLYGGIGKKSIEGPRKVYRVFPESL